LKDVKFRRTDGTNALFPNEIQEFLPAKSTRDLLTDDAVTKEDIQKAVIGIIVVCRLNSKRLPRKALLDLNGVPAIERCLLNTLASKMSKISILATSTASSDEELKKYTLDGKVKFFQGSGNDPADRMVAAADKFGIDILVRVTGDSHLISYELIDYLVESHIRKGADYSCLKDAPLGVKSEVINKNAIKKLLSMAETDGYSEYLTLFFKNNPDLFCINEVIVPESYRFPSYRLNLDYSEDYKVLKLIFENLNIGPISVSFEDVLNYLKENPEVSMINASITPKYQHGDLAEKLDKITKIKV